MAHSQSNIRIYVACLASYNGGQLHGRWIDANKGEQHIWNEVQAILAASAEPNAEEWAIHDYEGFEGVSISEYTSFAAIISYAEFITEHGKLGGKILEHYGSDIEDAKKALEHYHGAYENLTDYAEQLIIDTTTDLLDHLIPYIDYKRIARDMEMSGDILTFKTAFDEVHVFGAW